MSRLTNPFAFTILGEPLVGDPLPQLRAEGSPMSHEQIGMARTVYDRFAHDFRVTLLPFQAQTGTLPDGSPYRIVAMPGQKIMQVWPQENALLPIIGGVGMEAIYGGEPGLTIITFNGREWLIKAVPEFYGGSGVWVGRSGRYLTDDTPLYAPSYRSSNRHFRPGEASTPIVSTATSVQNGLAYSGVSGPGFGMFAANEKYVAIEHTTAGRIYIREAPVYAADRFAATPTEPEDIGLVKVDYAPSNPLADRVGTSSGLKGRGFGTRLRDGSAFCFATGRYGVVDYSAVDLLADGWLSTAPLEYEFQLRVSSDGYSDAAVRVTDESDTQEWQWDPYPESPPGDSRFLTWNKALHAECEYTQGQRSYVQATYTAFDPSVSDYVEIGTSPHLAQLERARRYDLESTYSRRREGLKRPVYIARDWGDKYVVMYASASESFTYRTVFQENNVTLLGRFNENLGRDRASAYYPSDVFDERDGDGLGQYTTDSVVSWTEPDHTFNDSGQADLTFDSKCTIKRTLHTQYGDIPLIDDDVTHTVKAARTGYAGALSVTDRLIVGRSVRRYMKHIDQVLGVIAFVELHTPQMSVTGYTLSTENSSASFVVLLRGRELCRVPLVAAENSSIYVEDVEFSSTDVNYTDQVPAFSKPLTVTERGYVPLMETTKYVDDYGIDRYLTRIVRPYENDVEINADVEGWKADYERVAGVIVGANTFSPPVASVTNADDVVIRCAIDPTSGGGVVIVHQSGVFRDGWAITPGGATTPVAELLAKARPAALGAIHELLVSV